MGKWAGRKKIKNNSLMGLVKTNLSIKRDLSARQPHFFMGRVRVFSNFHPDPALFFTGGGRYGKKKDNCG